MLIECQRNKAGSTCRPWEKLNCSRGRIQLNGLVVFSKLDNSAGISHHNAFDKTTEAELDNLCNVHFKGVFFSPRSCYRSCTMVGAS